MNLVIDKSIASIRNIWRMVNLRTKLCVIIIIICLAITGCGNSSFTDYTKEFNEIYYKIAKDIDNDKIYDALKKLQSEDNKQEIEKMSQLIDDIKDEVPSNRKELYEEQKKQYDGLVFLRNAYNRWDELTKDDKRRINNEIWMVHYFYEDYNK